MFWRSGEKAARNGERRCTRKRSKGWRNGSLSSAATPVSLRCFARRNRLAERGGTASNRGMDMIDTRIAGISHVFLENHFPIEPIGSSGCPYCRNVNLSQLEVATCLPPTYV